MRKTFLLSFVSRKFILKVSSVTHWALTSSKYLFNFCFILFIYLFIYLFFIVFDFTCTFIFDLFCFLPMTTMNTRLI